jgi:hypothetical protein
MKYVFGLLGIALLLNACNNSKNYTPAKYAIVASSEFVQACLKGDFDKASFYMIQDEQNKNLLKEREVKYRSTTASQQRQLGEASLQNITIEEISPTETIVYYKNSYDNIGRKVKAIFTNNIWLVDFKYSFNPNL